MATRNTPAKSGTRKPAPRASTSVALAATFTVDTVPTRAQVVDAIASGSKLYFDGDESGASTILPGILSSADSPLDVFATGELEKVEDHYGEILTVLSIDGVRNSDFEGGLGIYLVVSAATIEGEVIRLGVGSTDAVGKLVTLNELGAFPWKVSFERATKATKAGFFPVNLVNRQPANPNALKAGERPF